MDRPIACLAPNATDKVNDRCSRPWIPCIQTPILAHRRDRARGVRRVMTMMAARPARKMKLPVRCTISMPSVGLEVSIWPIPRDSPAAPRGHPGRGVRVLHPVTDLGDVLREVADLAEDADDDHGGAGPEQPGPPLAPVGVREPCHGCPHRDGPQHEQNGAGGVPARDGIPHTVHVRHTGHASLFCPGSRPERLRSTTNAHGAATDDRADPFQVSRTWRDTILRDCPFRASGPQGGARPARTRRAARPERRGPALWLRPQAWPGGGIPRHASLAGTRLHTCTEPARTVSQFAFEESPQRRHRA